MSRWPPRQVHLRLGPSRTTGTDEVAFPGRLDVIRYNAAKVTGLSSSESLPRPAQIGEGVVEFEI